MKVALLGDVALFGRFSKRSGIDCRRYFCQIAEHLKDFDLVVANLESPVGFGLRPCGAKSAYLASADEDYDLLSFLRIDAVNLANNHIFDFGEAGVAKTLEALDRRGIRYFGLLGSEELIVRSESTEVVLMGACAYNTNPLGIAAFPERRRPILAFDPRALQRRLDTHNNAGRVAIVSVHSGVEHVNYPSREDIRTARALASGRRMIYYGHHPHVVQGVETVGHSLIAYSLGNFCFDDVYSGGRVLIEQSENNRTGMLLELELDEAGLKAFDCVGIHIGDDAAALNPPGFHSFLAAYSEALTMEEVAYEDLRTNLISGHLAQRRSRRDLRWYLSRMRPRYARLLMQARLNARHQARLVGEFARMHASQS